MIKALDLESRGETPSVYDVHLTGLCCHGFPVGCQLTDHDMDTCSGCGSLALAQAFSPTSSYNLINVFLLISVLSHGLVTFPLSLMSDLFHWCLLCILIYLLFLSSGNPTSLSCLAILLH